MPAGDQSGFSPLRSSLRKWLPSAALVQIEGFAAAFLPEVRVKTTFIPSGERLGSSLLSFVPPTAPTTAPDGTLRIVTGPAQPEQPMANIAVATRSPCVSRAYESGPFLARSWGFWPTEIVRTPSSLP